jgi:hypothetical protein
LPRRSEIDRAPVVQIGIEAGTNQAHTSVLLAVEAKAMHLPITPVKHDSQDGAELPKVVSLQMRRAPPDGVVMPRRTTFSALLFSA